MQGPAADLAAQQAQYSPLNNWQNNTPALNPQVDSWTSQANSRLYGWDGGNVTNAYGGNQIGFGQTPLQNAQMEQQSLLNPSNTSTKQPLLNTSNTSQPDMTNPTFAQPAQQTATGGWATGNYSAPWGAPANPAGMTQPGAGEMFTEMYAPWDANYNAGTPATYSTTSGNFNGNPLPFDLLSMGNPSNKTIPVPTAADLMGAYGSISPGVAALATTPLQAYQGGNKGALPYAVNPYNPAATSGSRPLPGQSMHLTPEQYSTVISQINGTMSAAQIADVLRGTPMGPQGDVASTTNAYNEMRAAAARNPNDPFIHQQLILATNAMNTALYGPLSGLVRGVAGGMGTSFLTNQLKPLEVAPPKPLTQDQVRASYGYTGMDARRNVQQTLKSAGWDPTKGYAPQVFNKPDGTPYAANVQKTLNDLLSVSGRRVGGQPAPNAPASAVAAARTAAHDAQIRANAIAAWNSRGT